MLIYIMGIYKLYIVANKKKKTASIHTLAVSLNQNF